MSGNFTRDASSYRAGDVIGGRYRITGAIGKGGFGAVYAGEHLGTHQEVAIKMLAVEHHSADSGLSERFYREARITAALSHPNTVRVFDVGEAEDGPLYLVMELLRGPTLERVLRHQEAAGKRLSELQTIDLAIPILRALSEAHRADLVHRDLKPANIMLATLSGDDPLVKVLDFGLARTEDSSITTEGKSLGTPAYMSPEQCRGEDVDARSDLYALGAILYRCLAGRLPFVADKPLTLMFMHANEVPPDLQEVVPEPLGEPLAALIMQTLAKHGDGRPQSAQDMRAVLEAHRQTLLQAAAGTVGQAGEEAAAVAGAGSVRSLVDELGPLPPLLQKRDAPFAPHDAGPATREHSTAEPPTLQANALAAAPPPRANAWLVPALLGAGLLLVGFAVWLLLAGPAVRPQVALPAAAAPAAAKPAVAAPAPTVESVVREMAARKVKEAMTATGPERLRLLREALALDPTDKRLQQMVSHSATPAPDAGTLPAATDAGPAPSAAPAPDLRRASQKKRRPRPRPTAGSTAKKPAPLGGSGGSVQPAVMD